jgi:hypothetical protein
VSKIFILGKHEVKSTLSTYINPDDFPKRYGGNLDWDFGMVPHMDNESLKAVERDGRKGWVDGPCLWLDHKRFAVGSVNGKLRRPDSEIAALKPVVYAADKTNEPVHPNAAAEHRAEKPVATAEKNDENSREVEKLSAPANGAVPPPSYTVGSVHPSDPTVSYQNVQNGVEMDTQANKPEPDLTHAQSAQTAKNAETPLPVDDAASSEAEQTTPAGAGAGHATKASAEMNVHESLIHDVTTKKMQDEESVSVMPSNVNGSAHHDEELLVASDPTKGLVLDTDKMEINSQVKPPMDRFVTAVEEITTVNGRA